MKTSASLIARTPEGFRAKVCGEEAPVTSSVGVPMPSISRVTSE